MKMVLMESALPALQPNDEFEPPPLTPISRTFPSFLNLPQCPHPAQTTPTVYTTPTPMPWPYPVARVRKSEWESLPSRGSVSGIAVIRTAVRGVRAVMARQKTWSSSTMDDTRISGCLTISVLRMLWPRGLRGRLDGTGRMETGMRIGRSEQRGEVETESEGRGEGSKMGSTEMCWADRYRRIESISSTLLCS